MVVSTKDSDVFEQVVCPRQEGNPRNSEADVAVLNDGRLLLAWTEFYGGREDDDAAVISAMTSNDRGRTWSEKYILQENTGQKNVMSPAFLRLASGELAFFYLQIETTQANVYIRRSHDEGESWSEAVRITPDQRAFQNLCNARAMKARTGSIHIPIYSDYEQDHSGPYYAASVNSYDNGHTWERSENQITVAKRGAMEPCIVDLNDGTLLMIMRTQLGRIYKSLSHDSGRTWSEAVPMSIVAPESTSAITRVPSTGDLLLVWNNTTYDTKHDHFGVRCPLTAAISHDEGQTFRKHRDLESDTTHTYAMPSITFCDDEIIFTYYIAYGNDIEGHWELKLKIVPVDWLYQ